MGSDIFASEAFIQPGAGGSGPSVLTVHRDFSDLAGHTQSPSSVNGKRLPTGGMIRQLEGTLKPERISRRILSGFHTFRQAEHSSCILHSPGPGRKPVTAFRTARLVHNRWLFCLFLLFHPVCLFPGNAAGPMYFGDPSKRKQTFRSAHPSPRHPGPSG